ncbi:hypothetical protein [Aliiroseovarius marinus]|uniref:hypothetical protein n=1 Tax=Aliiroseovarius marinus TaxID=2500159 RepID=UPI003D7E13E7
MDFSLPSPLGAHATLSGQLPVRKPPDSSRVETAPDTGKTRADMHNSKDHGEDGASLTKLAQQLLDPDQPVGPPPSFQMNVLEMEQELQHRLASIEALRNQQNGADDRLSAASAPPEDNAAAEPSTHIDTMREGQSEKYVEDRADGTAPE